MEEISLKKKDNFILGLLGFVLPTATIILLIVIFYFGVKQISTSTIEKQENALHMAIERDIVQCYSIEGIYPPSLNYLEVHYGLVYDKNMFFVDYRPIAANIYPDVTILYVGKQGLGIDR